MYTKENEEYIELGSNTTFKPPNKTGLIQLKENHILIYSNRFIFYVIIIIKRHKKFYGYIDLIRLIILFSGDILIYKLDEIIIGIIDVN